MQLTKISLELKRDIRHERYNVSKCKVGLDATVDPGEDTAKAKNALYDQVTELLDDMIKEERRIFLEGKHALKNKLR